jgi:hypothetical protein
MRPAAMSELTPREAQVLFDALDALDALKTDNQLVALGAHSVCALLADADFAVRELRAAGVSLLKLADSIATADRAASRSVL